MATDDILLRVGMGRLEIEPIKLKRNKEENPFSNNSQKKIFPVRTCSLNYKCSCLAQKKKYISICKKKHNKLLREPVLRLSRKSSAIKNEGQQLFSKDILSQSSHNFSDNLYLHTLVDNCNQLSISSKKSQTYLKVNKSNSCTKWWKCEALSEKQPKEVTSEKSSTCSQQVLNPPCDITIDELASYFETLVHIPKKMSSMAEMMYI